MTVKPRTQTPAEMFTGRNDSMSNPFKAELGRNSAVQAAELRSSVTVLVLPNARSRNPATHLAAQWPRTVAE